MGPKGWPLSSREYKDLESLEISQSETTQIHGYHPGTPYRGPSWKVGILTFSRAKKTCLGGSFLKSFKRAFGSTIDAEKMTFFRSIGGGCFFIYNFDTNK